MKMPHVFFAAVLFLLSTGINPLMAQNKNCIYKDPVFFLDFGTGTENKVPLMYNLQRYKTTTNPCPNDGYYSFASSIKNCFEGKWHDISEDHTAGDANGKMMIVNAAEKPGDFFNMSISGLKPGATYRFSGWFANICRYATGCIVQSPQIEISIVADNKIISSFTTGKIEPAKIFTWQQYSNEFVMAANTDVITLQMKSLTTGGCGNDFALDDIEINQCRLPIPQLPVEIKKPEPEIVVAPPVIPTVIEKRANPVIKQIVTEETEINIELYDNGEIDGDTVSIYLNNQLLVSHAGISTKPVSLKIKVDKEHPHQELVMVADNLGRIPPNTSLMIITAAKKRYEVFISSSEEKNARILIDLQQ